MTTFQHKIDWTYDHSDRQQLIGCLPSITQIRFNEVALLDYLLFKNLSLRVYDLLRIALGIYTTDRVCQRSWQEQNNGSRWIDLEIGVNDPDFWRQPQIAESVKKISDFLSGDTWEITYCRSAARRFQELLPSGSVSSSNIPICLYSGGLDSAAGLALRLRTMGTTVIPVTIYHQAGQQARIKKQMTLMMKKYGIDLQPFIVRTSLLNSPLPREQELSQRCRSFLFGALGAAVACAEGSSKIEVHESGVGALNLPLMRGMITGVHTTRSSHPHFLRMSSELVSLVAGRQIEFTLPHRHRTKAEMVRCLAEDGLGDVAHSTISCVHYPVRDKTKQCGYCPACLGRRQAFISADVEEPEGCYQFDLFGNKEIVNAVPSTKRDYLNAMLMQIDRLDELYNNPLPDWFRQYMLGTEVEENENDLHGWLDVLHRYRKEWLGLIARGQSAGWEWARRFGFNAAA